MKKTLITLLALAGCALGANTAPGTNFNIDSSTDPETTIILDGTQSVDAWVITSTGNVTIAGVDGNSTQNIDKCILNVEGTLTINGHVNLGRVTSHVTEMNLGTTGNVIINGGTFNRYTSTALTLSAGLAEGETERDLLVSPSNDLNVNTITLDITVPSDYVDGGRVYVYEDKYYAADDVTQNGARYTVDTNAVAITLNEDTLYTVIALQGLNNATFRGISLMVGSASVPEPATATLSLLALAGLAARRRRK